MINVRNALVTLLASALGAFGEVRIEWVPVDGRTVVEVSGIEETKLPALKVASPEELSAVFSVRVRQDGAAQMLGNWQVDQETRRIRFRPEFPLTPGVAYRAEFDGSKITGAEGKRLNSDFTQPVPDHGPATVVTNIFPSAGEVPENLLKFYVHFSAAMSRGRIYEHIHLRDESGKDVELPFLEIDEELWDPDMKRLTLFIDPGRIKRGVRPLEEIGPSLEQGRSFTLSIDGAWRDAAGQPLAGKYEHTFRVGPPDRNAINLQDWKLEKPVAGSAEPLRVIFPKPMDHALALRMLRVVGADGATVEGKSELKEAEKRWEFTPAQPWRSGLHQIVTPSTLEDLAGNNVGKAFEVDLAERAEARDTARIVKLPFEVK